LLYIKNSPTIDEIYLLRDNLLRRFAKYGLTIQNLIGN
jgi:hypothetical protein